MRGNRGFTLVELVIVVAIVGILAAAVLPLARWSVKRQQEYELQQNLRILRTAIDRYHDLAVAGAIEVRPGGTGYPESLDVLVEGVDLIADIPSPVPGISDGYSASGFGLTGGYAGAQQDQLQGGSGMPLGAVGGDVASQRNNAFGAPGQGPGGQAGPGQLGQGQQGGARSSGLSGMGRGFPSSTFGQSNAAGRSSGFRFGGSASRSGDRGGRGGADVAADVDKIVFLRRLPVDPFTGDTNWGTRCYGDPIDDRSWCGRNVFDVYTNARGRGIDGRPYREW